MARKMLCDYSDTYLYNRIANREPLPDDLEYCHIAVVLDFPKITMDNWPIIPSSVKYIHKLEFVDMPIPLVEGLEEVSYLYMYNYKYELPKSMKCCDTLVLHEYLHELNLNIDDIFISNRLNPIQ